MGLAAVREWKMVNPQAVLIAAGFGFLMMLLSAWLTFKIKGLNNQSKNDLSNAVGATGRAYTKIPEKREGMGHVELTVYGKQHIKEAFSDGEETSSFELLMFQSADSSGNLVVS